MQICNVISTMSIIQYCFFYNNIVEGRIRKNVNKRWADETRFGGTVFGDISEFLIKFCTN